VAQLRSAARSLFRPPAQGARCTAAKAPGEDRFVSGALPLGRELCSRLRVALALLLVGCGRPRGEGAAEAGALVAALERGDALLLPALDTRTALPAGEAAAEAAVRDRGTPAAQTCLASRALGPPPGRLLQ
jgi:hypothetical protein